MARRHKSDDAADIRDYQIPESFRPPGSVVRRLYAQYGTRRWTRSTSSSMPR